MTRVRLYVIGALIVGCLATFCLSPSVGQDRRPYETRAQVYGVSAGRSDTARAIDAYEALMQRYMDTTERNFGALAGSVDALARTLDTIDARLASLDSRLARIEQHLGLHPAGAAADPNVAPMPTSTETDPLPVSDSRQPTGTEQAAR
jgi:hypothetical protein